MNHSLPGFSAHGISQAAILEWLVIFFSRGSSWPRDRTWVSYLLPWQAESLPLAPTSFTFHNLVKWVQFSPLHRCESWSTWSPRRLHETRRLRKGLEGWGSWRIAGEALRGWGGHRNRGTDQEGAGTSGREHLVADNQVIKRPGGTSLVVQWLKIHLPMQGMQVRILVQELRSHMPPQRSSTALKKNKNLE